jgi:hypothetical protein
MPSDIRWRYGVSTVITNAVAGLASDTNLLAGYESAVIDNTDGFEDIILSGKRTTGTSPTALRQIEIYAVAWDSNAWPDVFDGTTGAETITSADIKNAICRSVAILPTNNTSDRTYSYTGISAKQVFGGVLPSKFVLFTTHNTGVALNATAGNHEDRYQGIYPQVQNATP